MCRVCKQPLYICNLAIIKAQAGKPAAKGSGAIDKYRISAFIYLVPARE